MANINTSSARQTADPVRGLTPKVAQRRVSRRYVRAANDNRGGKDRSPVLQWLPIALIAAMALSTLLVL